MAISRQTLVLAGLVAILTVVCIALVIALDSYHGEYLETGEEANTELEPEAELKGGRRSNAALLVHPWEKNPRLSREVLPLHYELYLHPDLDSGTFMGESESVPLIVMCVFSIFHFTVVIALTRLILYMYM